MEPGVACTGQTKRLLAVEDRDAVKSGGPDRVARSGLWSTTTSTSSGGSSWVITDRMAAVAAPNVGRNRRR